MPLTLTSLGGAGTVTGSKHLIEHDGQRLLIDCGLFQGLKSLRLLNWEPLPIPPTSIGAVILTHAHLDHCGYLPRLVRDGFNGPIYASSATIDVARLILLDSAFLQEKDAEFANRHRFSRHHPALPLYDPEDAKRTLERFVPVPFHTPTDLGRGAKLLFRRAGHILGAATAQLDVAGKTLVFSGDLGRFDDPMMPDPERVPKADYLVVESTYGDRIHAPVDPLNALHDVITRTVKRGGTVVIPAFAVGRAQLLLYYLWKLRTQGKLTLVPFYVDSPMAIDATGLLCVHPDDHRLTDDACRDACAIAEYVRDTDASKALMANRQPKVIISASGMATGGRVLHHLKKFGRDRRSTILFCGFQAAGTRGRALLEGNRTVKMHGEWIEITAEIADLSMLSAHADSAEILRWLKGFDRPPNETFIVHGEPRAADALKDKIAHELGWSSTVSAMNEPHSL